MEKEYAYLLGIKDLPSDTCEICHKVLTNEEIEKYGKNKEVLCQKCGEKRYCK